MKMSNGHQHGRAVICCFIREKKEVRLGQGTGTFTRERGESHLSSNLKETYSIYDQNFDEQAIN